MELITKPLIIKTLSPFRLGVIQSSVQCIPSSIELISAIEKEVTQIKMKYPLDRVSKIESIHEVREAYRKLGNDPNRYRPAADSLIRRIVKGMQLYYINNVVDSLNLISIQSGFSIGGYDSSAITGNIELGIGRKNELYRGIGRGELNITNLPVLRDKNGAFGTPTSDSERTMIIDKTNRIIFIFYDFGWNSLLEKYLWKCTEYLSRFCFAQETSVHILEYP